MRIRAELRFASTSLNMFTPTSSGTRGMGSPRGQESSFWSSCALSLRAIRQSHYLLRRSLGDDDFKSLPSLVRAGLTTYLKA
jgi:hypothetical protein